MLDPTFFSSYLLPFSLALVMVGMGLSLTRSDFRKIFLQPKSLAVGLTAQMLALPIIAFVIAFSVPGLPAELKVGIVLVAACPGGATANLVNYFLRGNLALSVSLTAVNSFLTQFTIPIIINLALSAFANQRAEISLPFWETVGKILLITVIPAVFGVYLRARAPRFAQRIKNPLKYIMTTLLAIAMIGAIFLEQRDIMQIATHQYWLVLLLTLLLNFGSMFTGFYIARYYKLDLRTQTTIAVEAGLHHTALAIFIATSILHSQSMAIPAAIYAIFSFITTAGFATWINRKQIDWSWLPWRQNAKQNS